MSVTTDPVKLGDRAPVTVEFLRTAPDMVTTNWIAERFGVTVGTITHAIRTGRLPAEPVGNVGVSGPRIWLVKPEHALLVWGYKLLQKNDKG